MGIRRRAAAEDAELARAGVLERVPGAGRDERGVAGTDVARLAVDLEAAGALEDEVDLLGRAVVMPLRRLIRLERRLREALHLGAVQLADRGAVLRHEGLDTLDRLELHSAAASAPATRSCASRSRAVKNGSASVRELSSSDTGHIPSRNP